MSDLDKILEKIKKEAGKLGFAELLAWASKSDQKIEHADVLAAKLVSNGSVKIDYTQGTYALA
jgi:hypothetical protein